MATDQRNLPAFFNTNADFQAWCQGIHAQFVAAGWTQTADTGQINNTTVAKPAGTNTAQGYEIWRNSTSDIFFKIEYGSAGTVDRPSFWITLGSTSNGSGTVSGPASLSLSRVQFGSANSESAGATNPSYCSGDGTYLALATNVNPLTSTTSAESMLLMIDKIRDASGAATGEGFAAFVVGGTLSNLLGSTIIGSAAAMNQSALNGIQPGVSGAAIFTGSAIGGGLRSYGGSELVMPLLIGVGQLRFLKCGVVYSVLDFGLAEAITFTATNFGASHTYMCHPVISLANSQRGPTNSSNDAWALLWE